MANGDNKQGTRVCLSCGARFHSTGSGHRRCPACAKKLEGAYVRPTFEPRPGDGRRTPGRRPDEY